MPLTDDQLKVLRATQAVSQLAAKYRDLFTAGGFTQKETERIFKNCIEGHPERMDGGTVIAGHMAGLYILHLIDEKERNDAEQEHE